MWNQNKLPNPLVSCSLLQPIILIQHAVPHTFELKGIFVLLGINETYFCSITLFIFVYKINTDIDNLLFRSKKQFQIHLSQKVLFVLLGIIEVYFCSLTLLIITKLIWQEEIISVYNINTNIDKRFAGDDKGINH
ncbi:unnamed protein product [Cuscuta epithymum]|uniref:Uncharacterized protein n=1 Tax=Cuscuta epithymum TaxID=186058 RepID=A0AAV0BUS9_9ASTE|nr:unnamed protein product [Cuscuta epithymum]